MGRLYFDHNVSHHVGPLLLPAGHDLVFSRDAGTSTLTDDAMLLEVVRDDRLLVSHNRKDFRMLHDAWLTWPAAFGMALPPHSGIVVLDQAPHAVIARVLIGLLGDTVGERFSNVML